MKERFIKNAERIYNDVYASFLTNGIDCMVGDGCLLQAPSGYIINFGDKRFGVDNVLKDEEAFSLFGEATVKLLEKLDFILISHSHEDHFYPKLLSALAKSIPVYIPDFFSDDYLLKCGISPVDIIRFKVGDVIKIDNLEIQTFKSLHFDKGTTVGVNEVGFFIKHDSKKLLLPGDIRDYDSNLLPRFSDVDVVFAHVWLGRNNALNFPFDGIRENFCSFYADFSPKIIILTHLYEVRKSRPLDSVWTYSHCGILMDEFKLTCHNTKIVIPSLGEFIHF